MSGNVNMTKADKDAVINRINSIIREVNETVIGGRNQNYLRGGKMNNRIANAYPYQTMDNNGAIHIDQSPYGYQGPYAYGNGYMPVGGDYMPVGGDYMPVGGDYMPVGGCMKGGGRNNYLPILGGGRKRRPRSDKGKKRGISEWTEFVKLVANEYGLAYKDALKEASKLKKEGYTVADFKN